MTTLLTPGAYMALLVKRARAADVEMQLGNAVAVPVFEWVAQRLVDVDAQIRGKVGASTRASLRLVHGTAHAGRALEARRK